MKISHLSLTFHTPFSISLSVSLFPASISRLSSKTQKDQEISFLSYFIFHQLIGLSLWSNCWFWYEFLLNLYQKFIVRFVFFFFFLIPPYSIFCLRFRYCSLETIKIYNYLYNFRLLVAWSLFLLRCLFFFSNLLRYLNSELIGCWLLPLR